MTIKNGDLPAMPIEFNGFGLYAPEAHTGLSKREQFAAMAMQGLLANGAGYDLTPERLAESSLAMTDALLEALERAK